MADGLSLRRHAQPSHGSHEGCSLEPSPHPRAVVSGSALSAFIACHQPWTRKTPSPWSSPAYLSVNAGSIFNDHSQGVWFVVAKDGFSARMKEDDLSKGLVQGSEMKFPWLQAPGLEWGYLHLDPG